MWPLNVVQNCFEDILQGNFIRSSIEPILNDDYNRQNVLTDQLRPLDHVTGRNMVNRFQVIL